MELERKITVYDKTPEEPAGTYGEWRTRSGDIYSPKIPTDEPLKLECQPLSRARRQRLRTGREMYDGLEVVRALEMLTLSLSDA